MLHAVHHRPDANTTALEWIDRHHSQYLDQDMLVRACASHLVGTCSLPMDRAQGIALHALGEVQSRERPAYIDMSRSTSFALHVVDPRSGTTRMFTASQLLDMATEREATVSQSPTSSLLSGNA